MFNNVLVLLGGSDAFGVALHYIPSFVSSAKGQKVTLFQVLDQSVPAGDLDKSYLEQQATHLVLRHPDI